MTEVAKVTAPAPAVPAPAVSTGLSSIEQIQKMFADIQALKEKVAAKDSKSEAKTEPQAPPKLDWTKITEADINNLNIPIPVIEQETPEYLTVHLLDKNYIPRWIHCMRERLGTCLATGYEYVTEDMLDKTYPHPLLFDANGHYAHGDVVCLRITKERYFGALKKTYLKTMAIHGRGINKNKLKSIVQNDEHLGEAFDKNQMEFYTPDEPDNKELKGKTYTNDIFNAV